MSYQTSGASKGTQRLDIYQPSAPRGSLSRFGGDFLPTVAESRAMGLEFGLWAEEGGRAARFLGPVWTYPALRPQGTGWDEPRGAAQREARALLREFLPGAPSLILSLRRLDDPETVLQAWPGQEAADPADDTDGDESDENATTDRP